MTTYQNLTQAQGRIKELEAENAQLKQDRGRQYESLATAVATAVRLKLKSQEYLDQSRATIAALEARLESGVSALRQSEQLLNYLNSKGGLGLDVHDTIRRILADILASTALKTKVGES